MPVNTKIAISCGDLNGIGIETLLKTFNDKRMFSYCTPILFANEAILKPHLNTLANITVPTHEINQVDQANQGALNIINCLPSDIKIRLGRPDNAISKHVVSSLSKATEAVINGEADALVTLPINKDVISKADFEYTGHTEYLREKAGVDESLMFLVSDLMKVGLVTNHHPIKDVAGMINEEIIIKKVKLMNHSLINDFGITKPKIAVMGLNPHAGDNGLIGDEELSIIVPAIEKLTRQGIICVGPYSADGFFGMSAYSKYDGIMAMYHDQGLLPFKMLCFGDGVNFTAGLPFIRTSPDHGTAYDIAGKDKANPESLRNALFMANEIKKQRDLRQ